MQLYKTQTIYVALSVSPSLSHTCSCMGNTLQPPLGTLILYTHAICLALSVCPSLSHTCSCMRSTSVTFGALSSYFQLYEKYSVASTWYTCEEESRLGGVEPTMIWTEYQAYLYHSRQIGVSACGATAIINVLVRTKPSFTRI